MLMPVATLAKVLSSRSIISSTVAVGPSWIISLFAGPLRDFLMACPITNLDFTSLMRQLASNRHSSYDASPLGLSSSPEKGVIFGKGSFSI